MNQCEPCGIKNFISTIDREDLWRFTDVMEKINSSYNTVCDTCKYKILYEYYFNLSYSIHYAVRDAMDTTQLLSIN